MSSNGSPLHALVGSGKVADILLWKDKQTSAAILLASTLLWAVFELVGCHLVALLSGTLIASIFILFVWSVGNRSGLIKRRHPTFDEIKLPVTQFRFLFEQINQLVFRLYSISTGRNVTELVLTQFCLLVLLVLGSQCSTLTLIYITYLLLATLPALYEQYQEQIHEFAGASSQSMKSSLSQLSYILDKIPRATLKED